MAVKFSQTESTTFDILDNVSFDWKKKDNIMYEDEVRIIIHGKEDFVEFYWLKSKVIALCKILAFWLEIRM